LLGDNPDELLAFNTILMNGKTPSNICLEKKMRHLDDSLPGSALIALRVKIKDMIWILWEGFGAVISIRS
jgi:hypothetical protein